MAGTNTKKKPATRRSSTTSARTSAASRQMKQRSGVDLLRSVLSGRPGRILIIIGIFLVVIGLNFLLSFNSMDKFFIAIGIEFILLVLIGWIRFVIRGRSDDQA